MERLNRTEEDVANDCSCLLKRKSFILLFCLIVGQAGRAADWPHWRGPNRTDVTAENSGWPKGWPPKRLWKKNVGYGCTSPIIVDGHLYVMGWRGKRSGNNPVGTDTVHCFEAVTGKLLWERSYRCRYQGRFRVGDTSRYGGPTSTPTSDTASGYLYTLSIDGDLKCWNTKKTGQPVWSVNLYEKYKIRQRPKVEAGTRDYGYSCSPVVLGNAVITEVGGNAGLLVAFDKKTGRQRWRSASKEPASHNAGPVPVNVQGIQCLASFGIRKLTVVRTDDRHRGETLAQYPWPTAFACNIITPAVTDNKVVISSGHDVSHTALLEISRDKVRQLWSNRYWSEGCSPVIHKGTIYLVIGQVHCVHLSNGKLKWRGGNFGRDSSCFVTGDDKLLVFGSGDLGLVDISPKSKKYRELTRVKDVVGGTCYPHLALADGMLAVKNKEGDVVCLSVRPH
jgi:outer membrane protein assembly factor BamB